MKSLALLSTKLERLADTVYMLKVVAEAEACDHSPAMVGALLNIYYELMDEAKALDIAFNESRIKVQH